MRFHLGSIVSTFKCCGTTTLVTYQHSTETRPPPPAMGRSDRNFCLPLYFCMSVCLLSKLIKGQSVSPYPSSEKWCFEWSGNIVQKQRRELCGWILLFRRHKYFHQILLSYLSIPLYGFRNREVSGQTFILLLCYVHIFLPFLGLAHWSPKKYINYVNILHAQY